MPRRNEGRTETCLQRAVTVYPRSFEQKDRWKTYAKSKGLKLSAFVIEAVESTIEPDREINPELMAELHERVNQLNEETNELRRSKEMYKKLYEIQEKEIRKYRAEPFLKEDFNGVRKYNKELVELLRYSKRSVGDNKSLSNDEILSKLEIEPSESEAVKSIYTQLENLESYGLVKLTAKGWRWTD